MTDPDLVRNPVEMLAEEFLERYRLGERPGVTEYVDKHPELADEIREVFPALLAIEAASPHALAIGSPERALSRGDGVMPDRLGDFRIIGEIGRGGMGVVYEAVQESLGRQVALKVLPRGALADPVALKRFKREARSVAALHHSNIVPVFGIGEHAGYHFYAMQLIYGQTLEAVLAGVRRLRDVAGASPASTLSWDQRGDRDRGPPHRRLFRRPDVSCHERGRERSTDRSHRTWWTDRLPGRCPRRPTRYSNHQHGVRGAGWVPVPSADRPRRSPGRRGNGLCTRPGCSAS